MKIVEDVNNLGGITNNILNVRNSTQKRIIYIQNLYLTEKANGIKYI